MILNQLLFGYNQGHSLLSASIKLAQKDRDLIQQLSDWSDFQGSDDDLSYISGFPLETSDCYAISKTWYANEMQRPGCAWTHVLLINKNDFALIDNIDFILGLFIRPNINEGFLDYSNTIELNLPENNVENNSNELSNLLKESNSIFDFNSGAIKELLFLLYTTDTPIYVTANQHNSSIEYLFLKIWWLQHLKLRYVFTFCSGTSMPRKYLNRTFDLQVISSSNYKNDCVDMNKLQFKEEYEVRWINKLFDELTSTKTSFITFLNRLSSDITVEKNKLPYLINLYQDIEDGLIETDANTYIYKLINDLAEYFPNATEGIKLKEVLLRKDIISSFYKDSSFIKLICLANKSNAFDFNSLNIIERSNDIYNNNAIEYFHLIDELRKQDVNEFGIELLSYAAKKIQNKDISILKNDFWTLFVTFVRLNSKISFFDSCWEGGTRQQYVEIVNILFRTENKDDINWKNVLYTILSYELDLPDSLYYQIRTLIPNYISLILDWHNSSNKVDLLNIWVIRLRQNESDVLKWISNQNIISYNSARLITNIIDPNSNNVKKATSSIWEPFLQLNFNQDNDIDVHMFLTAVAFNFRDEYAFKMLQTSFLFVYYAFAEDKLNYSHVYDVLYHTKPLRPWKEWDKCKKLRNALADKFIEARWDKSRIKDIVRNDSLNNVVVELYYMRS